MTAHIEAGRGAARIGTPEPPAPPGAKELTDVLDSLTQGVAVFDGSERLVFYNPRFEELMGFPEGFLTIGLDFTRMIRFNQQRGIVNMEDAGFDVEERVRRVLGRPLAYRAELRLPDGHMLALRRTPLEGGGFVNTYTRITRRKRAEDSARRNQELLQAILDNMADGIRVFDGDLRLIAFNRRAIELFDCPPEMCRIGMGYEEFARYAAERGDYDNDLSSFEERVARARTGTGRASTHHLPDGRIMQKRRNPMPGGGFVSTYTDVTAIERAQAALAAKARELEAALDELRRSNTELEQFAYVASHDLQEPLRMVASYCQLIARRFADKLDADGQEFIAFAVDGAERMQRLINDLLAYSRVGTRAREPAPVALDEALDRALGNLKLAIEESGGRVVREPLPTIMGDGGQMTQLFQNLIGNALKFRDAAPPEVRIGARAGGDEWRVSVADNGIGMEPAYFDRIFLIFQRLHERGKYPGTGIGLAICKKIVERHGGRIEVASEPGRGSTFTFSLPKHGEAP